MAKKTEAKPRMLGVKDPGPLRAGVAIEVTNSCPNNCVMCTRRTVMTRPVKQMSLAAFDDIIDSIWGSGLVVPQTWLHFGLAGEPLCHRRLDRLVEMVSARGFERLMIDTSLMTSKTNIERLKKAVRLDEKGVVHVKISPHFWQAGKKKPKRAEFYKYAKQLKKLLGDRLFVGLMVPEEALIEKERAQLARQLGIEESEIACNLPADLFAIHGLEARTETRVRRCPVRGRFISVDGDMYLCCHDMKPEIVCGNVLSDGFKAAWTRKLQLFDAIRAGQAGLPEHCCGCPSADSFQNQLANGFRL